MLLFQTPYGIGSKYLPTCVDARYILILSICCTIVILYVFVIIVLMESAISSLTCPSLAFVSSSFVNVMRDLAIHIISCLFFCITIYTYVENGMQFLAID